MAILIRQGERVANDPWILLADGDDLPPEAPIVVSLGRWQREQTHLSRRNSPLGIRLRSDEGPEMIADALERIDLVILEFPTFTDGRPYSSARLLRERYGFTGEIRAVANVLRDQFQFMARCGIDAFEVDKDADAEAWHSAVAEIGVVYQPAADSLGAAIALRRQPEIVRATAGAA